MSYIALYRKWRPLIFEDVVEQEHVVKTLKNSINSSRIAHAYLFCGTRGTGKTTMAKIFSRAINCLNPNDGNPCNECDICQGVLSGSIMDVVEIDAASNNSVDNVRGIRDEVIYTPSQAKFKVYIIDEVHMLSTGAFNALLKTLEEPPSHVVFILATTEPHKLPATILSRCQRFDFRRIPIDSIVQRINHIARESGVTLHQEAARLIAKLSDGALRDAISILDQCISLGNKEITYDDVLSVVGIVNNTFIADVVDAIQAQDINKILELIECLVMDGKDIVQFVDDLVLHYRSLLMCSIASNPKDVIDVSEELLNRMKVQCSSVSRDTIIYTIKELSQLEGSLKWAAHPRVLLEVALIKLCESNVQQDYSGILDRLALLENKLNGFDPGNLAALKKETAGTESRVQNPAAVEYEVKRQPDQKVEMPKKPVKDLQSIAVWNDVLQELKKSGRMVLYTNLMDAKAVELDNRIIGILFGSGSSFNKMSVSRPENQEVVEALVSGKLGREIRIKCLSEEDFDGKTKADAEEEKDELIEKAEEIAKRANATLNIIDE